MNIEELLNVPGCERIKDYYAVGPVQRAAVESLVNAVIAAQPTTVEEPELPEAVAYIQADREGDDLTWVKDDDLDGNLYSYEPLFTAAQMQAHYAAGVRAGMGQSQAPQDGLPLVISGAIFDFAGFLTTRPNVIGVGSTANASPMADLVKEWAALRGLSLDDAAVLSWQEWLKAAMQGGQQP